MPVKNRTEWQRKRRRDRIAAGLCIDCGIKATVGIRCDAHALTNRHAQQRLHAKSDSAGSTRRYTLRHRQQKHIVITHYGPCCRKCGENRLAFLTIDHINDDGATHRKNDKTAHGNGIYRKLIAAGFPDGYQCLCWNCNYAKSLVARTLSDAKTSITKRKESQKLKAAVLDKYGGPRCTCCGLSDPDLLTVDHIDGQGNKHRSACGTGLAMYRKMLLGDHKVRILCFNCNCGRHINGGVCPHEEQ